MHCSVSASDDPDICAVCLERACNVAAEGLLFSCLCTCQCLPCVAPLDLNPLY
jgi:E3 ubiquitin-protein ligase XBAT32/33